MKEDSHQCQPDCDCRRCALVHSAHLAALPYCKHAQQRRCYDRTYGYAAGRHGDCRSAVKESLLHTAQLSSHCAPSAGRTDGGTASSQCHPRIYLDCGRQGDSHDGVPVRHHAGLCDCYLDGAAVQPGCGAFECPVCTQHIALYNYNAHHDRSV